MLKDLRFTDYFLFTQHSLATFDNCPLKFKKRYLEGLKWNSIPDEEVKKRLEKGNDFHLLAYRYFMGIDPGLNELTEEFGELNEWIESLKKYFKMEPDAEYFPEYKLRMISPELRLESNYDLLLIKDNSIEIWDWKTHSESGKNKRNEGKRFRESLQTIVYMFVLKEQSKLILGKEIDCGNITMYYWQPDPACVIEEIRYSSELHNNFKEILKSKVHNILEYDYSRFDKAVYSRHCKHCEFNWYCNNEKIDFQAMEEADGLAELLDWDSVEERY